MGRLLRAFGLHALSVYSSIDYNKTKNISKEDDDHRQNEICARSLKAGYESPSLEMLCIIRQA